MRPRVLSPLALTACLAAVSVLAGCASLQPFDAVRARVPAHEMLDVAGQTVHVEQAGAGAPVVLLHGFGESTYSFRHLVPRLAERHRVIAIDLNGFGYTERPREPAAYTLDGQQRLVLGVLDRLGVAEANFAGHSYGGALTLWIAAHHPERVRSMVLIDTAMPLYSTSRRSRAANLRPLAFAYLRAVALREGYIRKGLRKVYEDDALATREVARAYLDRLRIAGIDKAYYGLTAEIGEPPAVVDLASIAAPALVVWGSNDPLTPVRNGERIAAALADARFVSIPACGHVPMEERPRELLAEMLPFLEAAVSSPGGTRSAAPPGAPRHAGAAPRSQ